MFKYTEIEYTEMFQRVFSGKNGETVLDFFENMYQNKTSHIAGDPYSTAFNEGQRSVYLQIKAFLSKDVKQMEEEQKKREQEQEEEEEIDYA